MLGVVRSAYLAMQDQEALPGSLTVHRREIQKNRTLEAVRTTVKAEEDDRLSERCDQKRAASEGLQRISQERE